MCGFLILGVGEGLHGRTGLSLHGTYACVLEEEPVIGLVVFAGSLGVGDLVVGVVAFYEAVYCQKDWLEKVKSFFKDSLFGFGADVGS